MLAAVNRPIEEKSGQTFEPHPLTAHSLYSLHIQCIYYIHCRGISLPVYHIPKLIDEVFFWLKVRKYHDEQAPQFPGSDYKPGWTTKAEFILPEEREGIPVYRVLKDDGDIVDGAVDPEV